VARRAPQTDATLVPALVFTALVTALISSLGAPLIPTIARATHSSISTTQWTLTATLLVGAVTSPVFGRLGDGPYRREALLGGLTIVVIGCITAALTRDLVVLVIGRSLQGAGLGLLPLAMAVARDDLPSERAGPTIALLSVSAAAGVGVGYPVSGLIADQLGLAAGYWFGAIISTGALTCAFLNVPSSRGRAQAPLDLVGAGLLSLALISLLVTIAQMDTWGLALEAPLLIVAGLMLLAWLRHQLHTATPLVQLRLLLHPTVLTCNVCGSVLAVAMYVVLPTIIEFVQTPHTAGYGFGESVVVAGLSLVPMSLLSFTASRALPSLMARFGSWALLPIGCILVAAGPGFFLAAHGAIPDAFVVMAFVGAGIGLTSALIPSLIVRAVPPEETGSALGFFQVVRFIGYSVGSALSAAIVAAHTQPHRQFPTETGYTESLWVACAICVTAASLAVALAQRGKRSGARPVVAASTR
jgi:MFS family permease